MNWFKRYGIVGMFFIIMTGMWFFCLFPENCAEFFNENDPKLLKLKLELIGGFCWFSFLPFGYIIVTFSQLWHYLVNSQARPHCRYWQDLLNRRDGIIGDIRHEENARGLGRPPERDEARMEAILSYYHRRYFTPDVEINKFLSIFASKRADVVAINNGLIWALIFSFITAICMEAIVLDVIRLNTLFVIILALSIIFVLWRSARNIEEQIFEIGRRMFGEDRQ